MKKRFFILLSVFFSGFAWSLPVSFAPSSKSFSFVWEDRYRVPMKKDIGADKVQVANILHFDTDILKSSLGVNFSEGFQHVTTQAVYAPRFLNRFDFGVDTRFHFFNYSGSFREFDFLAAPCFRINFWKFSFATEAGYFKKLAVINALNNWDDPLQDDVFFYMGSLAFDMGFLRASFETSTVTYFDYFLFCTPVYDFSLEIRPRKNLGAGASFVMKWTDQFTVASHCSETYMTFFFKVII